MNGLIVQFKSSCHLVGSKLGYEGGRLNGVFGVGDFLMSVKDSDDHVTLVLNAIRFFCEDAAPNHTVYRFAILTVCEFLHRYKKIRDFETQTVVDLAALLKTNASDKSIRDWVASHFP